MPLSHELRLSSLSDAATQEILLQLEKRELRILSQIYCAPDKPIDPEVIARKLSHNIEFTLTTKVTLQYDTY